MDGTQEYDERGITSVELHPWNSERQDPLAAVSRFDFETMQTKFKSKHDLFGSCQTHQ
jgi:hypothetical protein